MQTRNVVVAAAVLSLVAGAGCTRTTSFEVTKTFDPVNAQGGVPYAFTEQVDLQDEAGSAWKHRSKIKSLELVGVDATMTQNYSHVATTGSGTVVLSRAGLDDVAIGSWTNHPIPANGPDSIAVTIDKGGVALIENALRGDGRFAVVVRGETAATVSFAVDVTLHLELKYKIP